MTGNWTDYIQEIRVDEAPPTQPVPSLTLPSSYCDTSSSFHTGSGTQRASDGVACCLFISFLSLWFTN
ncbi:hypothetical protein HanXRQr2_Chr06g0257091 [Helianthus annuus]|uniref:Uncharacterized protein n=1 Tax=Helianthus annuus TaxID=4232 RepID=A0A9K3ISG3_HELAN|nr:hypothetical protein HanXRQr2_Chr06g0257091 [Helianthus annuus]KAJ0915283.1 hypothetical protein HanPSC8_Chr06g0248111 [Helianthus annuus]